MKSFIFSNLQALILDGRLPFDRKWITKICLYGAPIGLTIFMAFVYLQGDSIDYVHDLGSISMVMLVALLVLKPLSKVFVDFGIIRTVASFPKELGMMMFYFSLAHGLSYLPFGLKLWKNLPNYEFPLFIKFGLAAFLTCSILYITSNKFSMKLLGKKWFMLHKLIYIVFFLTLLHVYFINPDESLGLLGLLIGIIVLKLLSWKKVELRLFNRK